MPGKHRKPEPEPIIGRPPKRLTDAPQSQPIGHKPGENPRLRGKDGS